MELKNMDDIVKCPHCGSIIVSESISNKHINGQYNETREFECGHRIVYSPNFRTIEYTRLCKNHPDVLAKKAVRKKTKEKLFKYINRLDVDEEFRNNLNSHLKYSCYYE